MLPLPTAAIPIALTVPTTITIPPTIIILPTAILTDNSKGKPSNSIKVVPTVQRKKKNIRNARKKNYQSRST